MTPRPVAAFVVLSAVAVTAAAQGGSRPRWTEFAGVRIGASSDDVLELNGECRPVLDVPTAAPMRFRPDAVAQFAFGFSLPHHDPDTAAVRAALANATLCRVMILDGSAMSMVVAIDRLVVGVTTIFLARDSANPADVDSVRALVWRAWGRPTAPSPTLDSWLSPRYRGYLLVRRPPPGHGLPRQEVHVIMVDVAACTAFDRRVHLATHHGTAERC